MNKETRAAHKESIQHWDRHAKGKAMKGESIFSDDCALCKMFLINSCTGCPVAERTGLPDCRNSPWQECEDKYDSQANVQSAAFRKAAAKQRDFLKSLLPTGKKGKKC